MEHYAGIDVPLELSSVCVVDAGGKIVAEAKIESHRRATVQSARPRRLRQKSGRRKSSGSYVHVDIGSDQSGCSHHIEDADAAAASDFSCMISVKGPRN
jgi:hypothetical protein